MKKIVFTDSEMNFTNNHDSICLSLRDISIKEIFKNVIETLGFKNVNSDKKSCNIKISGLKSPNNLRVVKNTLGDYNSQSCEDDNCSVEIKSSLNEEVKSCQNVIFSNTKENLGGEIIYAKNIIL